MILADTRYFVALLNRRDALHPVAYEWSQNLHDRVVVTEYVAVEVLNYFSNTSRRGSCTELILRMRTNHTYEWVAASPHSFEGGLALYRGRPDKGWSLTDCISFEFMQKRGILRALTSDEHFTQAGFDALLCRSLK